MAARQTTMAGRPLPPGTRAQQRHLPQRRRSPAPQRGTTQPHPARHQHQRPAGHHPLQPARHADPRRTALQHRRHHLQKQNQLRQTDQPALTTQHHHRAPPRKRQPAQPRSPDQPDLRPARRQSAERRPPLPLAPARSGRQPPHHHQQPRTNHAHQRQPALPAPVPAAVQHRPIKRYARRIPPLRRIRTRQRPLARPHAGAGQRPPACQQRRRLPATN